MLRAYRGNYFFGDYSAKWIRRQFKRIEPSAKATLTPPVWKE
jgi:hypothetical protein